MAGGEFLMLEGREFGALTLMDARANVKVDGMRFDLLAWTRYVADKVVRSAFTVMESVTDGVFRPRVARLAFRGEGAGVYASGAPYVSLIACAKPAKMLMMGEGDEAAWQCVRKMALGSTADRAIRKVDGVGFGIVEMLNRQPGRELFVFEDILFEIRSWFDLFRALSLLKGEHVLLDCFLLDALYSGKVKYSAGLFERALRAGCLVCGGCTFSHKKKIFTKEFGLMRCHLETDVRAHSGSPDGNLLVSVDDRVNAVPVALDHCYVLVFDRSCDARRYAEWTMVNLGVRHARTWRTRPNSSEIRVWLSCALRVGKRRSALKFNTWAMMMWKRVGMMDNRLFTESDYSSFTKYWERRNDYSLSKRLAVESMIRWIHDDLSEVVSCLAVDVMRRVAMCSYNVSVTSELAEQRTEDRRLLSCLGESALKSIRDLWMAESVLIVGFSGLRTRVQREAGRSIVEVVAESGINMLEPGRPRHGVHFIQRGRRRAMIDDLDSDGLVYMFSNACGCATGSFLNCTESISHRLLTVFHGEGHPFGWNDTRIALEKSVHYGLDGEKCFGDYVLRANPFNCCRRVRKTRVIGNMRVFGRGDSNVGEADAWPAWLWPEAGRLEVFAARVVEGECPRLHNFLECCRAGGGAQRVADDRSDLCEYPVWWHYASANTEIYRDDWVRRYALRMSEETSCEVVMGRVPTVASGLAGMCIRVVRSGMTLRELESLRPHPIADIIADQRYPGGFRFEDEEVDWRGEFWLQQVNEGYYLD